MRFPARAATLFAAVLVVLSTTATFAPPAHALRTAKGWITTMDPTAGTATETNINVVLGADDDQSPQPTGTVTVTDNGKPIGTAVPGPCRSGAPCFTFKYVFEAGDHSLVGHYAGDSQFGPFTTDPLPLSLGQLQVTSTTTSPVGPLLPNGDLPKATTDQSITFATAVAVYNGPTVPLMKKPTGSVTFYNEEWGSSTKHDLATVALSADGHASFTTKFPTPAIYTILARYSGDRNYSPTQQDYGNRHELTGPGSQFRVVDNGSPSTPGQTGQPSSSSSSSHRTTTTISDGSGKRSSSTSAGAPSTGGARGDAATSSDSTMQSTDRDSSEDGTSSQSKNHAVGLATRPTAAHHASNLLPLIVIAALVAGLGATGVVVRRRHRIEAVTD